MSTIRVTTNFKDNDGVDLGDKLITKDYLISVYPAVLDKMGISSDLWVWGSSSSNALGQAVSVPRSTPITTLTGGANWVSVDYGTEFSLTPTHISAAAIKSDGSLWMWGDGRYGETSISSTTPTTIFGGGSGWKQVSPGGIHTAAIKTDGTLWTWGSSLALGINENNFPYNKATPVTTFAGGNNWKQVSCGYRHTAAIKTDGTLWTWGYGLIFNDPVISTPVTTFAGGTDWKQVSSGVFHTSAIKTDGTLWIWGRNTEGCLGNNTTTDRPTPVTTFAGGTDWKQVSSGVSHTAAVKTDGTLWVWGAGGSGRLGNNSTTDSLTPVTIFAGGTDWKQVSSGVFHTAAIKTDGTLWTWGANGSGQLGNNSTTDRLTPVTTFAGGTNWKQVSCGARNTAAIKSVDF